MLVQHFADTLGLNSLKKQVLAIMPSANAYKSFNQVSDEFSRLQNAPLWKFVPTSQTGPVKAAMSVVQAAQFGKLTSTDLQYMSGLKKEIGERLGYCASHSFFPPGSMALKTCHGQEAIDKKITILKNQKDDKGQVDPDVVAEVMLFKFILSPQELSFVEKLADENKLALGGKTMEPVVKKVKKAASSKTPLELALDAADNLFG